MTAPRERDGNTPISTITIESTDLPLGRQLASLVDALRLGPAVNVAQTENPNANSLSVSGTGEQLRIFRVAFEIYNEAVNAHLSELAIGATMNNFFRLKKLRYGQKPT